MCGRVVLSSAPHQLAEQFFLDMVPDLIPGYNITPGQDLPAVVPNPASEGRLVHMLKWGLELPWARDHGNEPKLINARSETVLEKRAFGDAFRNRRCLIPVDGFYEWQKRPDGRQPFYFSLKSRSLMALAGIWESREYPGGHQVRSCSILTTAANGLMRPVHHRMPVILPAGDWKFWLDLPPEKAEDLVELLRPLPGDLMHCWPVSRQVNSPQNDSPGNVQPVWDDRGGQLNLFG
jgi:putative SOS response-associated peptidase YedK